MPDESVNCIVTSPPYWGLRDYGVDGQIGLETTPTEYVDAIVGVFREVRRVLRADGTLWLNLGDSYAGSWGAQGRTGEMTGRSIISARQIDAHPKKASRTGSIPPGSGLKPKDLVGIPWRVAFALQADGWYLRSDIVWAKPNPMPESVLDRPTKAHEYLFLMTKSERYWYDAAAIREQQLAPESSTPDDAARAFSRRRATATEQRQEALTAGAIVERRRTSGNVARKYRQEHGGREDSKAHQAHSVPWTDTDGKRNKRSVWTVATEPYGGAHFATFPKKLVEPCILAGCPAGGVVLDPFGGSGTVGEVAEALGRNWILFDLNPEYVALAEKRTSQQGLFVKLPRE